MRDDPFGETFRDPDVPAWVDLLTNFASLPNVRLEHVRFLEEGRVPVDIVNTVMHEMMHHWCFFSPVGDALALLQYRVRHALLAAIEDKALLDRSDYDLDVVCDIVRHQMTVRLLSPLIEGLALLAEFDADADGSADSYCAPLTQFAMFILRESLLSENAANRIHHLTEIDEWLRRNRTRKAGVERKADQLASPLHPGKSIYLPGYLALKAFVIRKNVDFSGSYDKALAYLRDYFFCDYGLVNAMFAEDDPVEICRRVSEYMLERMQGLFERDLTADLSKWDPSRSGEGKRASEAIKLAENVYFKLPTEFTRGINVPDNVARQGYRWHRGLFKVFEPCGESPLLKGHKLRAAREFAGRRLMPICSERILASTVDGMTEARDAEGQTVARMQQITGFEGAKQGLVEFFFIPTENRIVGATFVDGTAVAFAAQKGTKTDFLGLLRLLEPTPVQLEALENARSLDRDLVSKCLSPYDGMMQHFEKQYAIQQDAVYRPAVSYNICDQRFDWRKTLGQLDDIGLMSVLETKMELLDIARLSLLASRPQKRAELSTEFARDGRDLEATLELVDRLRNSHGLCLIETTTNDEIVSMI
jgi:hypothetical protein